jgi:hypothetical protein
MKTNANTNAVADEQTDRLATALCLIGLTQNIMICVAMVACGRKDEALQSVADECASVVDEIRDVAEQMLAAAASRDDVAEIVEAGREATAGTANEMLQIADPWFVPLLTMACVYMKARPVIEIADEQQAA